MKKILSFVFIAFIASVVFAASYKNNTYQKLAKEYTIKAEKALDAGEYVLAEEYAQKAQENADLSDAYIAHMMAKETADRNIALAKNRIEAAKKLKAEENFPMAFEEALKSLERSNEFYAKEDYENASNAALQVINLLAGVYEVIPLPKYYIVRPWATHKDCFWNISGRPYVYNNPYLWENLYQANKNALPKPEDPNLILPGMKMEIPSITGEYREGVYSPDINYEPYKGK